MIEDALALLRKSETGRMLVDGNRVPISFDFRMPANRNGVFDGDMISLNPRRIEGLSHARAVAVIAATLAHELAHERQKNAGYEAATSVLLAHPEDCVLLFKMGEADAVATSLRVAFELARGGHSSMLHCWLAGENIHYGKCMGAFRAEVRKNPDDFDPAMNCAFCAWFSDFPTCEAYERQVIDKYEDAVAWMKPRGGKPDMKPVRMPAKMADDFGEGGALLAEVGLWFPAMPAENREKLFGEPFTIIRDVTVFHDLPLAYGRMRRALATLPKQSHRPAPPQPRP